MSDATIDFHSNPRLVPDDVTLRFGTGNDTRLCWSTADAGNHSLVLALGDANQALHVTDAGAVATDWNVAADTHPTLYLHSNTTPATDYLKIGGHDGTSAHIDVVGGTTLAFDIAGTNELNLTANALGPNGAAGLDLGSVSAGFNDLHLDSGGVVNFDGGDVTLKHSAAKVTWGGDGAVEIDFNNHEMTNVDINSGAIDGTTIGAAAVANGSFSAVVGTTGTYSGVLKTTDTTATTSPTTGSAQVGGGLGVAGAIHAGALSTFERTGGDTTTQAPAIKVSAISTGNVGDGFGPTIQFEISDTGVTDSILGFMGYQRNGADNTGEFTVLVRNAGVTNEGFRVDEVGELYGDLDGTSGTYFTNGVNLFDELDDPVELERFTHTHPSVREVGLITKEQWLANRQRMEELGIIVPKKQGGYMLRLQTLSRLLAGGIYQNAHRINGIEARLTAAGV